MRTVGNLSKYKVLFGILFFSVIIFTYYTLNRREMNTLEPLNNSMQIVSNTSGVYDWLIFGGGTALILTILGLIISFCIWWGGAREKLKKTDKFDDIIEKINVNFNGLSIGQGILTKQFETMEKKFELMQGTLNILGSEATKTSEPLVQSNSPVTLTDAGKNLVRAEKIQDSIDNKWDEIKKFITENCIGMNPYDIQEFLMSKSITDLEKFLDDDGIKRLKNRAYNEGVPLEFFGSLVAVLIRDRYLEEKGILVEEIDKYDPNKMV